MAAALHTQARLGHLKGLRLLKLFRLTASPIVIMAAAKRHMPPSAAFHSHRQALPAPLFHFNFHYLSFLNNLN